MNIPWKKTMKVLRNSFQSFQSSNFSIVRYYNFAPIQYKAGYSPYISLFEKLDFPFLLRLFIQKRKKKGEDVAM